MQARHRLVVLQGVQTEAEAEALGELIGGVGEMRRGGGGGGEEEEGRRKRGGGGGEGSRQHLDGVELIAAPVDTAGLLLQLVELVDERLDHGLGAVRLVVLPGLAQGRLNDVAVVVVEGDVVLEHVGGRLGGQHVVDHELAVARQEVPPLVQLLDLLVVVHLLVLVVHEHVVLHEEEEEVRRRRRRRGGGEREMRSPTCTKILSTAPMGWSGWNWSGLSISWPLERK